MTVIDADPAPLLEADHLAREFATPSGAVRALRDASLAVRAGEMVALTGPSGSGKSTLLHLLGLMDTPTSGSYRLAGVQTTDEPSRKRSKLRAAMLGFVFQAFHLVEHRSVLANVELPLVYARVPAAERAERAHAALDWVSMGHRSGARPSTCSGGERQRIAIARAMVREPALLLCDEPTGNLDSVNSRQVMDLLRAATDRDIAVLLVTHDPTVADRADRSYLMSDGVLRPSTAK